MKWGDRTIVWISLLSAVLIGIAASYLGFLDGGENRIRDKIQTVWGEQVDFSDIVIIDIGETSMRALNSQLGAWPYDRQVYAVTLEYLRGVGVEKIAFDILFSEERHGDSDFERELGATKDVFLASTLIRGFRYVEEEPSKKLGRHIWQVELPPAIKKKSLISPHTGLLKQSKTGIIRVFPDRDGVVRRMPLVFDVGGSYVSSMMLSMVADSGHQKINFDWSKNVAMYRNQRWPVSDKGEVTLKYPINFTDLQVVPFYKLLLTIYGAGDLSPDTFRGKTVFIGSTASILGDFTYMPGKGRVHGLGVLALAYHSLKHGSLLRTNSYLANAAIALSVFLLLAVAIKLRGVRPTPLIIGYLLGLLFSFMLVVMFYRSHNTQAWFLLPALVSTLFVMFATLAKSLSMQLEGQRLRFEKQAAEEARDLKAKFLAHMTHELRTPLTAIMGYNKLLIDGELESDDQADYLKIVEQNSEHLLGLINNILDQSQIEAQELRLVKTENNIRELVEDVMLLLKPIADNKSIQLSSMIDTEVPELLTLDRTRMKQIVINLVGNALKFIEQGRVSVKVAWADNILRIAIRDTGPGIPESDLNNIFESFQQVESVAASGVKGTGLGLTISTNLAHLMGGKIEVESKLGSGSTFTLSVEAEASGSQTNLKLGLADVLSSAAVSGHVLLVEDNKNSSKLITLFLEMAGYDVKLAEDGQQALDAVSLEPPALILMDMNMPVMDGRMATQKIREAGFTMPVLALTASNDETIISGMREAGCNGEIEKPVNADMLIKSVSRYVS